MHCPNCDARIKNGLPACPHCGTRVEKIENASNYKAKQILRKGKLLEREKVFKAYFIPKDINKKDLLLLTIFLGWIGAHDFYVGRYVWAITKVISLIFGNILAVLVFNQMIVGFDSMAGAFLAYPISMWLFDVVRVLFKRYPIPAVIDEENETGKI